MASPEYDLHDLITVLQRRAHDAWQREFVVLSGAPTWVERQLGTVTTRYRADATVLLSPRLWPTEHCVRVEKAEKLLGSELDLVVYDALESFQANAFAAACGSVRGGGMFVLLLPALDGWLSEGSVSRDVSAAAPEYAYRGSRFMKWVARRFAADQRVVLVRENHPLPVLPASTAATSASPYRHPVYGSNDQQAAVEAIVETAHGHTHRPLVITSDRGRGKTSALGIAAAQLLNDGARQIVVTAPRLSAVAGLFERAASLLPDAHARRGEVAYGSGVIRFVPPDALILDPPAADLVFVDEAAAIPVSLLTRVLERYARIVFATTVHGYEGTGRGFELRFAKTLDSRTPGWRALQLQQPIRWRDGDPLEAICFDVFLLRTSLPPYVPHQTQGQGAVREVSRDRLLTDPSLLRDIFGLLVTSHYRTTPDDLQQLLDDPQRRIFVLTEDERIVAAALVAIEGGFSQPLAAAVFAGFRRPPGHLLAQSLANHAGVVAGAAYRFWRVVRIAVHPLAQGHGYGSTLLGTLVQRVADADAVGASFGGSPALIRFWKRNDFLPVRVGVTRDHTSGMHSVLVLKPISAAGKALFEQVRKRFLQHFPVLLKDYLGELETDIVAELQDPAPPLSFELDKQDWTDIISFAYGARVYECCLVAVRQLVVDVLRGGKEQSPLDTTEYGVIVERVLKQRDWSQVVDATELRGRDEAVAVLRGAIRKLVSLHAPQDVRYLIGWLEELKVRAQDDDAGRSL